MKTVRQLIERLDTEIEMVCCDSARIDWQTLKAAVLEKQTTNNARNEILLCGRFWVDCDSMVRHCSSREWCKDQRKTLPVA
jgi:hypothetical protein